MKQYDQVLDDDAVLHFANLTNSKSLYKNALNNLIIELKSIGVWSKTDVLTLVHANKADSLLNIKDPAGTVGQGYDFGTVTYVDGTGLLMDSVGGTLAAGVNLSDDTADGYTNFIDDSLYMFAYTQGIEDSPELMEFTSTHKIGQKTLKSGFDKYFQLETATAVKVADAVGGFTGGTQSNSYKSMRSNDITNNYTSTEGPFLLSTEVPFIGGDPTGVGSDGTLSGWGFGGALTDTELDNLQNAIEAYMVEIGCNVL